MSTSVRSALFRDLRSSIGLALPLAATLLLMLPSGCSPDSGSIAEEDSIASKSDAMVVWPGADGFLISQVLGGSPIVACLKGDGVNAANRPTYERHIRDAIGAWLKGAQAASRVPLPSGATVSLSCTSPHVTVNLSAASGRAQAGKGWINLYAGDGYSVVLHEFGHVFGIGDTYVEGLWTCQPGQPNSVMCGSGGMPSTLQPDDEEAIREVFCLAYANQCSRLWLPPTRWSGTTFKGTRATTMADVNGDGRADAVAVNDGDTWVMLSNGAMFGAPTRWAALPFVGSKALLFADVNGDRRADGIAVNGSDTWVMLSNGFGFASPVRWSSVPFYGSRSTVAADVDGNGRTDLVAFNDTNSWVMLSTGSGFAAPTLWSSVLFYGAIGTQAGDVNGDGKADAVAFNGGSVWVMTSTGSGFTFPQEWSRITFQGNRRTMLSDVNGDGKLDAVAMNDTSAWVMLSFSYSFTTPFRRSNIRFYGDMVTTMADVNGDGKADGVALNGGDAWVSIGSQ